jgi:hypothetical protein
MTPDEITTITREQVAELKMAAVHPIHEPDRELLRTQEGIFRRTIRYGNELLESPATVVKAILAHELGHIRNRVPYLIGWGTTLAWMGWREFEGTLAILNGVPSPGSATEILAWAIWVWTVNLANEVGADVVAGKLLGWGTIHEALTYMRPSWRYYFWGYGVRVRLAAYMAVRKRGVPAL